jgi:hypothetical protein
MQRESLGLLLRSVAPGSTLVLAPLGAAISIRQQTYALFVRVFPTRANRVIANAAPYLTID